jgi:hypothetical protein
VEKVVETACVNFKRPDGERGHVAEEVAEADDADGGGQALVPGGQLLGGDSLKCVDAMIKSAKTLSLLPHF